MSKRNNFKIDAKTKSVKFNYPLDTSKIEDFNHKHPIFCFRHQHNAYNLNSCDLKEKGAFLDQICTLSTLTWEDIQKAPRHGVGSEKIAISKKMRAKCPAFITQDIDFLLALRFDGKKPFLVHRDRFIAHVIFIDNKFEVYGH